MSLEIIFLAILIFHVKFAMMVHRRLENYIKQAIESSPSVVLVGPRQVGKTTIALSLSEQIPAVYLDLENSLDISKVQNISEFHTENRNKQPKGQMRWHLRHRADLEPGMPWREKGNRE